VDAEWLNELAEAILDGTPAADSGAVDAEVSDSRRAAIRQAHIVARIADLHRTLPADDADVRPEGRTVPVTSWGRLTIVEEIGRGAFGAVYRAKDPRLDREVALKLLRRDAGTDDERVAASVVEEGRLLARVHHPNVVTIYDADRIAGRVGLTMELVRGWTLEQELRQRGPFPANDVIAAGIEISRALAAVHDAGLLHRDIKTQNVMRHRARSDSGTNTGRLVLMDFGAGRELLDEPDSVDLTGTPLYLAPEVFAGQPASVASDIYSVGVLLYHLATRSFPVVGRSLRELRALHARGHRRSLGDQRPDFPAVLVRIIERAIDPDPACRYRRAADLEAALVAVAAPHVDRARRTAVAALIVGAFAIAAGGFALWRPARETSAAGLRFQARDSVLITRFDNRTGEPIFDGAVEYALERELTDSDIVGLVPRERVDDALRLMKRAVDTVIDRTIGREVCLRDGHVKALLAGRIEKFGTTYVLTAELVDPSDDRVAVTLNEEAAGQQAILAALHRQASRVRLALGEQRARLKGADPNIEPAATTSLRAFQLYNQSYQLGRRGNWASALELARQVVAEDPQFGAGWIWLAWAVGNASPLGPSAYAYDDPRLREIRPQYRPYLERALALAETSPEWEQAWIKASYYTLLGDDGRAVPFYQALLTLRPDHFYAANNLEVAARRLNRVDLVVSAAQLLSDQRPNDFIANAEAATRTIEQTRSEQAARPYVDRMQTALQRLGNQVRPQSYLDFMPAYAAWHEGDVKRSLDIIDHIAARAESRPTNEVRLGLGPGLVFWYLTLGRASAAARIADRLDGEAIPGRQYAGYRALVSEVIDDRAQLRLQLERTDSQELAPMYVRAGLPELARREMRRPPANPVLQAMMDLARGELSLVDHHPAEAIPLLEAGLRALRFIDNREYDRGCESLATALTSISRQSDAIAALEGCVRNRVRSSNPVQTYRFDWMRTSLRLADEYRAAGRIVDAAPIEQELTRLLAYADSDFPLLLELRSRR